MDPLGGVASVIAVIQITGTICSLLKSYYESVRDARDDIASIYKAVRVLGLIVSEIGKLVKRRAISAPLDVLEQCHVDLKKLEAEVSASTHVKEGSKRQKIKALKWPLKRNDVETRIEAIERHKTTLSVLLGTENVIKTSEQVDIVSEIREDIKRAGEAQGRTKVVKWLFGDVDPSTEQNAAEQKHEANTGSWLTSSGDLQDWLKRPNSLYWLNGGAGSGKTILSSNVVNTVRAHCKDTPLSAMAFWYFTFTDQKKQDVSNFLSSLIGQLCAQRRDTPKELDAAYVSSSQGSMRPSISELKKLLFSVLPGFDNVYIIVDALDECSKAGGSRGVLMDLLKDIMSWREESLHVFLTSRKEIDIEQALESCVSSLDYYWSKPLQQENTVDDIQMFIGQSLEAPCFSEWDDEWKNEVKECLSNRAQGSFRLVALQLDELRPNSMLSTNDLQPILQTLPTSLDESHDRILLDIHPRLQDKARIALRWLAFSVRPLMLSELAEALAVHAERKGFFDPKDRLRNASGVLQILPAGLITIVSDPEYSDDDPADDNPADDNPADDNPADVDPADGDSPVAPADATMVRLAHFSVKEYLTSDRVMGGKASAYHLDELESHTAIASACLAYLIYSPRSFEDALPDTVYHHLDVLSEDSSIFIKTLPLLGYAARCWPRHIELLGQNPNALLDELVRIFFTSDRRALQLWQSIVCSRYILVDRVPWLHFLESKMQTPDKLAARRINLDICCDAPLATTLWLGLSRLSRLLLDIETHSTQPVVGDAQRPKSENLFGSPQDPFRYPEYLMMKAAMSGDTAGLQILIDNGVEVDPKSNQPMFPYWMGSQTALEAAVSVGNYETTRFLIRAGADVNLVSQEYRARWGSESTTPLSRAVEARDANLFRLLATEGADPNILEGEEHVLFRALCEGYPTEEMVGEILRAGASEASICFACSHLMKLQSRYGSSYHGYASRNMQHLQCLEYSIRKVHGEEVLRRIVGDTGEEIKSLNAGLRRRRMNFEDDLWRG